MEMLRFLFLVISRLKNLFLIFLGLLLIITTGCATCKIKFVEDGSKISGKIAIIKPVPGTAKRVLGIMNGDGSEYHSIPNAPLANIHNPRWSPDGNRILFIEVQVDDSSKNRLLVINSDGTDLKEICRGKGINNASFSPDGKNIVFNQIVGYHKIRCGKCSVWIPYSDIFIIRTDGTNKKRLAEKTGDEKTQPEFYDKVYPSWSPNGKRIAYYGRYFYKDPEKEGQLLEEKGVYTMDIGGADIKKIDSGEMIPLHGNLSWSPDGRKLAISGYIPEYILTSEKAKLFYGTSEYLGIWLLNINGSNPKRVKTKYNFWGTGNSHYLKLCWSSDGKQIMYSYHEIFLSQLFPSKRKLFLINSDGTNEKEVMEFRGKYSDIAFEFDWWTPRRR
jgi:Tol biopolymer transport system component